LRTLGQVPGGQLRASLHALLAGLDGPERRRLAELTLTLGMDRADRAALRSAWASRRVAAVRRLSALRLPDLRPALAALIEDRSPVVAAEAALGLAALGDSTAMDALARLAPHMGRWAPLQLAAAARDLGALGVEHLERIAQLHAEHAARSGALEALGLLGTQDAARVLLSTTHSPDHDLRARAARIIGVVGCTVAMDRLLDLLHDPRWEVRCQAARSLGRVGTVGDAGEALRAAMRDEMWWVRRNAAHALWDLGIEGAQALFEAAHADPDRFARDIALDVLRTHGVVGREARLEDLPEWSRCSSTPSTWPSSSTQPSSESPARS
jgi:HEAT repeat protein